MSHVLVTGGAGFIGSHLVDRLLGDGYEVTVLDNLTNQVHDGEPDYLDERATYVKGDIRDRKLVAELLEEVDILSHQASAVGVGQSMYEIERYVDVNTMATASILDIIVSEDIDLEQIITASSMSIYGEGAYFCGHCEQNRFPQSRTEEQLAAGNWEHSCEECGSTLEPKPTPESKPRECTSVYAVTKRDQEELTLSIGRAYDIPAVALRYFNTYGSRQALENPYTGVCAIFSSRIKNGNPPLIFEDGKQSRDFVHVSDVARANHLAIRNTASDVAVNVGTGNPTSIREVAETLIELYDADLEPQIANEYRAGDIRHCYADISRAKEYLDYEPEVDFEAGMSELVEWAANQDAEDNFEHAQSELEERGLIGRD